MADLLVPRIQPTVVGYNGWLYVIGGRNSNKVRGVFRWTNRVLIWITGSGFHKAFGM